VNDITSIVRDFSDRIEDGRDARSVFHHLLSEADELGVEITAVENGKPEGVDGVVGEAVDVIACALDLIIRHRPGITNDEIAAIMRRKCQKWADKYGTVK
jgi:CheY-like chemotaxis protein